MFLRSIHKSRFQCRSLSHFFRSKIGCGSTKFSAQFTEFLVGETSVFDSVSEVVALLTSFSNAEVSATITKISGV